MWYTPCLLFFFTWHPFSLYLSHYTYVTITSFVHYPNSSRSAFSGTLLPQCSSAFFLNSATELFLHSCCTSCGLTIHAAFSFSTLLNPLQYLYNFSLLPSNSALSLVRVCFLLSRLLMRVLYWVWDIMSMSQGIRKLNSKLE